MATEDKARVSMEQADLDAANELIAHRAYELYEQRGRADGYDAQDWFQAELEILGRTESADAHASGEKAGRRKAGRNQT